MKAWLEKRLPGLWKTYCKYLDMSTPIDVGERYSTVQSLTVSSLRTATSILTNLRSLIQILPH